MEYLISNLESFSLINAHNDKTTLVQKYHSIYITRYLDNTGVNHHIGVLIPL